VIKRNCSALDAVAMMGYVRDKLRNLQYKFNYSFDEYNFLRMMYPCFIVIRDARDSLHALKKAGLVGKNSSLKTAGLSSK